MAIEHRVVIIGGGFAGLYAAKALGSTQAHVTLLDKRNFHLFQPLLYQVATGGLSPGDIASPLRSVLNHHKNIQVFAAEVTDILPDRQEVIFVDGKLGYDSLILATGVRHDYFGKSQWARVAPGLKTVEDALEIRRRIFVAFEAAERADDPEVRKAWMTFVVVGGGPTGVEMAGALGELALHTLKDDFLKIRPAEARILLVENSDRIMQSYPVELSAHAQKALERLGVSVRTGTSVTEIEGGAAILKTSEKTETVASHTILWAAGVKASPLGEHLAKRAGAELDRAGRVLVNPDLTIPNYPNIFVIGDLACFTHQTGKPLPGLAPVAMQQGDYVARLILERFKGKALPHFQYRDKGSMAVIGRNSAVAVSGNLHLRGFPAWLVWLFVHLFYLIGFDNKFLVLFQWGWNYFTRKKGARLITGESTLPSSQMPAVAPKQEEGSGT